MVLARLALRVAERVSGSVAWRSLLLGFVWAFVANSRRVRGDLPGAEQAFRRSDRLWAAGADANTGLLDGSRLLDLRASLLTYQGRLVEALSFLDQALEASLTQEARGRILIKKAIALRLKGDYEQAIDALHLAETLQIQNPRFPWLLGFNFTTALWHLGKFQEAEQLLPGVRRLAVESGNDLDLFRVLWLAGRLAAGMGRRAQALEALEQVQGYFAVNRIAFDAALASMEVAVLQLEEGRTAEVKRLAEEMYWIFKSQEVTEEVLEALRLFCEAAKQEEATAELARRVVEYLQKACHQPHLRFEDFAPESGKT
ncbi:MAG: hypothetical protein WAM82_30140 [Thermoanaerobaculia bacterium]